MEGDQTDPGGDIPADSFPAAGFPNDQVSWGSPSITAQPLVDAHVQPASFHNFDVISGVPYGQAPREDALPPSLPSFSSPPSHGFPSAFDVPPQSYAFPPATASTSAPSSAPPPVNHAQPPPSADSIDQLLSLFPTVPLSSSTTAPPASGGPSNPTSGSSSPNMGWAPTSPPSQPFTPAGMPHVNPPSSHMHAWPSIGGSAPSHIPTSSGGPYSSSPVTSTSAPASAPVHAPAPAPSSAPAATNASVSGFTPSSEAIEKAQKVPQCSHGWSHESNHHFRSTVRPLRGERSPIRRLALCDSKSAASPHPSNGQAVQLSVPAVILPACGIIAPSYACKQRGSVAPADLTSSCWSTEQE